MDNLLPWLTTGVEKNPLTLINPVRFFSYWYYSRQMRNFLSKKLDYRLAYHQEMGTMPGKSVVDLALKAHLEENNKTYGQEPLDPTLKMFIMNQINVFIFAGHDTTSSTICYIYYLLASNPECLELVRAEYDTIFGKDLSTTASQIKSNPRILNNLSYSLAVIKEAMRLFPTSASIRQGQPGISITDEKNRSFPTEYCMVFCFHQGIGRNADLWPEPDKFIPGRFLVGPEDPLYPVKGAWRPFEIGPRECIGQELTMLELKTAMALTIREFDIKAAYDELDQLNPPKGPVTVNGERMYQIIRGAAHPVDGFPCRVTKTTR